jgi:hypothetical protein
VVDIGIGWTRQSPGWDSRRGENQSEGRQGSTANGIIRVDLSKALWKSERVRYMEITDTIM